MTWFSQRSGKREEWKFVSVVLMNLYLGCFQRVHSFSKHWRKDTRHVSEKRRKKLFWKGILFWTIPDALGQSISCRFTSLFWLGYWGWPTHLPTHPWIISHFLFLAGFPHLQILIGFLGLSNTPTHQYILNHFPFSFLTFLKTNFFC